MADHDFWGMRDGSVLQTHGESECSGTCPLHAPSDHPLKDAPLNWRADRYLMERICPCGVGHPDPDHLDRVRQIASVEFAWGQGVHGCCGRGCCRG